MAIVHFLYENWQHRQVQGHLETSSRDTEERAKVKLDRFIKRHKCKLIRINSIDAKK